MSIEAVKGQKVDLTRGNPGIQSLVVEIGWHAPADMEIDASAFLLGAQAKVSGDDDLIFYNNPVTPFIRYKDVPAGGSGGLKHFEIELGKVPSDTMRIAFAVTLYNGESRRQTFGQMSNAHCRILNRATGEELMRCNLGNHFSVETAVVVGELYRYNSDWKFSAIVAGFEGGLKALCGNYGIEVEDEPAAPKADNPPPRPAPAPAPPPAPVPSPPPQLNLKKIELKKKGDSINLKKSASGLGEVLINLNWNQRQSGGLFSRKGGVDLDLACLYELKDGRKGVVQALGKAFGSLQQPPFIMLDGDDRTGSVKSGENLRINGSRVAEIKRVLIFSFIYQGVTHWSEADGVVTIHQGDGPDIIVNLDEHNNRKGMCAIALIQNVGDETFSIERLVQYFSGHQEMDQAYSWGLRWVAGSK
ncbi:tellurium resistance protein TerA [Paenibacillus sp. FSL R7-0273]|uniref:TerD family protein n=1 Tax=Paenibacillus sp. FSL R7-0273 TaxID=1536772 RepID=UPI0004F7F138|nr:TerD family protein [Paenibacillus sp. FSL R7-0273]AIQ44746.1 tellurium resistance protein TerA [Paenibacillus sp. FSL R7-0273]OMF93391.1 tellurium resistance protein TerA [Paenibacillus sp. FSL R7-0273]